MISPRFTFDAIYTYTNQKCFIIQSDDLYLLGILNSSAIWELLLAKSPGLIAGYSEPRKDLVESIGVPRASDADRDAIAALVQKCLDAKAADPAADVSLFEAENRRHRRAPVFRRRQGLRAPPAIKLYHIVHVDRLASILRDGHLFCDAVMMARADCGTTIGMSAIKARRLRNRLASHPRLVVGDCVPFYFCPRSVMLYLLHMGNHPDLAYRGGQEPILHLQLDLRAVASWAKSNHLNWAFTLSNAGANFFEDRADLAKLDELNCEAVQSDDFRDADVKEGKQAEFLVENRVPWTLVDEIGIHPRCPPQVQVMLQALEHRPALVIRPGWYY